MSFVWLSLTHLHHIDANNYVLSLIKKVTIILKILTGSKPLIVCLLTLPEPPSPLCVSVPALPFRRTSLAEEQQLHRVGQSGLHRSSADTDAFRSGFPSSARGGQRLRDAPLDRGSVSVKSDKENETEKGRSVALLCQSIHNSGGITGPD